MNPNFQNKIDDAAKDRCLRYLLGELSQHQTTAFESDLAQSPELCDEVDRLSQTLCQLSDLESPRAPTAQMHAAGNQTTFNRWFQVAAALAACLLIAFVAWNTTNKRNTTNKEDAATATVENQEDLLIALAWADTDVFTNSAPQLELDADRDANTDLEMDTQSYDDSLSWVMTAVESGVSVDG